MQSEDRIRLLHMIDAAEATQEFVSGRTRADLDTDRMLEFALTRAIEIIGEAANNLSEDARGGIPAPWLQIRGMRNRLVHAYFDVDRNILGKTVSEELPDLLHLLRLHLPLKM